MPGKFESSNLSRDNASREIGRTAIFVLTMLVLKMFATTGLNVVS